MPHETPTKQVNIHILNYHHANFSMSMCVKNVAEIVDLHYLCNIKKQRLTFL